MRGATTVKLLCLSLRNVSMMAWVVSAFVIAGTNNFTAQSTSAALIGTVVDGTGAVLSGANVSATNQATSITRQTQSGADGSFVFPTLSPGRYVVIASHAGFQSTELPDVVLAVDDRLALRLELPLAQMGESVNVVSDVQRINTSSAVSTVIDRKFVENLPLNGRSLQALLELTPGVVLTPAGTSAEGGQFSVNGQRTSDNNFVIDGVSANVAASSATTGFLGASGSGQLPALTAQGGTNGLVSVDALQEFRIQTSGYAPEFGRVPGGQISLVTRSGTNVYHGSAFEYFRHDALDATDWFVKRSGGEQAELRQHDFGGVFGGPILRNRSFAFGSYERLHLLFPQARNTSVPNLDTRRNAAPAIRPYLDALPQPNGQDLGNGYADFLAVYSDPSELHSTSVRVDHNAGGSLRFFGRISDAHSSNETRAASYGFASVTELRTQSATLGMTWLPSDRTVYDLRVNFTGSDAGPVVYQRPIGGATLLSPEIPSGRDPNRVQLAFQISSGAGVAVWGPSQDFPEDQFNLVSSVMRTVKSHELKFGVDFRRVSAKVPGGKGTESLLFDLDGLRSGIARQVSVVYRQPDDRAAVFDNISLYAQDHWKLRPNLTLNYGVRWDLVPPPRVTSGVPARTVDRFDNLYQGQVGLAPEGTEFWTTNYTNFAPRLGGSYIVLPNPVRSLVLRGGVGTFYGLGYGQVANGFGLGYPFSVSRNAQNVAFPVNPAVLLPPNFGDAAPGQMWVMDRQVEQPYTIQWNVSADQGLGARQMLSVGYVGANGHRLLKVDRYQLRLTEWPANTVALQVSRNLGYSDYHALQVQFKHRLTGTIQALASYTLARSRDTGSSDAVAGVPAERLPPALDYGYSSFDVRHVFSAALTYQAPDTASRGFWRVVGRDWGVDFMVRARSGSPLNVVVSVPFPPDNESVRPNIVPGQPFWLDDRTAPGGRRLNRGAFSVPLADTQGDLPRGSLRGFSLSQVDVALRRQLPLPGPLRVQLRVEAFNLFNTPNFAPPIGTLTNANFGVSTQMLGRSLGGQNALFQMGGPRSIQLAAKVTF